MYDFSYNFKIIVAKNIKRLNISCNPVGQEEKQGLPGFLLLFFRLLRIRRNPPLRYGESSYKGDGEMSDRGTKKEPIPQTKNTCQKTQ